MKILGKHIVDESGNRISASDFWNYAKKEKTSLNLILLGIAKPIIKLYIYEGKLYNKVGIKTDVGIIYPTFEEIQMDYILYEKYWIPLDLTVFSRLIEIVENQKAFPETSIPIGRLYRLLADARTDGIEIFDVDDWDGLETDTSLTEIKLALPLYEYQKHGVSWLTNLYNQEIGGLLCDEMGLGKTAQAFGLIKHAQSLGGRKILVVTPASLTINWSRELQKFIPNTSFYLHKGSTRKFNPADFDEFTLVIVSYDLLVKDFALFFNTIWDLVICDEAQALKNSDSRRHQCVFTLSASRKILITGTPVENSLRDLWSLINIVRPGLLGTKQSFSALIDDEPNDARRLSRFAHPLILRRLVQDVAKDLPELVTIEEALVPNELFAKTYEEYRKEGLKIKGNLLPLLTKLTQMCCYPRLIIPDYVDPHDVKMVRTIEILRNIREAESQKVIIFSTFTQSIELLKNVISRQLNPNYIAVVDGRVSTEKRMAIVDTFENVEGFAVLLIQPNAGGIGLNITAANHVIHFNRQWNPAVEKQATARAYRRGQEQTVFEYRMFYLGTIEEYISERLADKTVLADYATIDAVEEGSDKDIRKALEISPMQI